jgi:riboflavin kinase/FMN adenylyltransferase
MPKYRGGELYGQTADIRLRDFIRAEKRFDSLNDLKREIFLNSKVALSIYENHEKHNA